MHVVRVDGCRGGWIAVAFDVETNTLTPAFHPDFQDVVASYPAAACIAIDIPIGLTDLGPRQCDVEARRRLGWPRRASVFPAPSRSLVTFDSHAEASRRSREMFGRGIAIQAFGIYRKVHEVDLVMTPALQDRVVEVHPEVSFWAMAGERPMRHSKKHAEGFAERRDLLEHHCQGAGISASRAEARHDAPFASPDDYLDAIATAWTARRVAENQSMRLPDNPPRDLRGLRMEIVY